MISFTFKRLLRVGNLNSQVLQSNQISSENIQQFKKFRLNSQFYIDKSKFIQRLLEVKNEAILISRPRRWGKTMLMNMAHDFFQVDTQDGHYEFRKNMFLGGETKIPDDIRSYHSKKAANFKFDPLQISKDKDSLLFQGTIPTIYLNFQSIMDENIEGFYETMRKRIQFAFRSHQYIEQMQYNHNKESQKLSSADIDLFMKFCRADPTTDLQDSLLQLTRILNKFHRQKVLVLIDEYDAPFHHYYNQKGPIFEQVQKCFKGLYQNGMKDNPYMFKTVITGVAKLTKQGLFSSLNNYVDYGVDSTDQQFSSCCGFTKEEIEIVINNLQLGKIVEFEPLSDYYNGYNIGKSNLYNPWSIYQFLNYSIVNKRVEFRPHWANTGSIDLIRDSLNSITDNREIINNFFSTGIYIGGISDSLKFDELKKNIEGFFTLLLHAGYLTRDDVDNKYKIPNEEVRQELMKLILPIWKKQFEPKTDYFIKAEEMAQNIDNMQKYEECLKKIIEQVNGKRLEMDFEKLIDLQHRLVKYTNVQKLKHNYYRQVITVQDNKIADGLYQPISGESDTAVLEEFKVVKGGEKQITSTLEKAFWQIFLKKYLDVILKRKDFKDVTKFIIVRSIVFHPNFKDSNKWDFALKQYKISVLNTNKINKLFSNKNGNMLDNHQEMLTGSNKKTLREEFLNKIDKNHKSIFDFLETFNEKGQDDMITN